MFPRNAVSAVVARPRHRHLPRRVAMLLLALFLLPCSLIVHPTTAAAAGDARLAQAALWAGQQVGGGRLWIDDGVTLCGAFVERAYGMSGIYPTAYAMYRALGPTPGSSRSTLAGLSQAPVGALVFFAPNARNGYSGHVGIYAGGGQFIGVGSGGHIRRYSVPWWSGNVSRYLGWSYPPSNWTASGRAAAKT